MDKLRKTIKKQRWSTKEHLTTLKKVKKSFNSLDSAALTNNLFSG